MPKERNPEEVYRDLAEQGAYGEASLDNDEAEKVKRITIEDYEFGQGLKKLKEPNWRVIFKNQLGII